MSKRPITIEDFETDEVFICPFCGHRITSRRKTTIQYVELTGDHYSECASKATPEKMKEVIHSIGADR